MARYAQSYLDSIAERSPDIDGKVRELVAALLPTGRCSIERVAEHLGCDRRTIHRHLAARSVTFSEIVDAQRAELVVRMNEDQTRSLPAGGDSRRQGHGCRTRSDVRRRREAKRKTKTINSLQVRVRPVIVWHVSKPRC